jgi:signal transduction histidine kinase/CheY-like chemotaxis protein
MENIISKPPASSRTCSKQESIRFMMNNLHQPAILCKWGKNENITIIDFNQSACRLLGFEPAELNHRNIYEIFTSESIRMVRRNLNPIPYEGDDIWEAELQTKKRKKLQLEITNYKFMLDGGIQFLLSFRDLSEYKENIASLATYKNFFDISESTRKTGFWEYDLRSEKLWTSDNLRSIFGLGQGELSVDGVPELQLKEFLDRFNNSPEGFMKTDKLYENEFDICRIADNAVISIWSMAEVSFYENKIYGIVQDVSQHKIAEKKLLEEMEKSYRKNRLRQAFISNLSDEIYAPMNRIIGYCELLNQPDMPSVTKDNFMEYINKSCSHLHKLITDIVDISRIEEDKAPFQTSQICISDLLNETLIAFKHEAEIKNLDIRLNPGNLQKNTFLISDESKLVRVIFNLLDNAIRFTMKGYIEFGVTRKVSYLEFYVKDTGIGMSQAQYDIISKLFYETDPGSTPNIGKGLGLSISKYYVNLLGGSIRVDSKLGEGTTFYFTIPLITEFSKVDNIVPSPSIIEFDKLRTCLIVDSLEVNYFYLRALLRSSGFNVLWAKDNDEAIYMSITERVDVVLMNLKSDGPGNSETIKLIRRKRPSISILALTEDSSAEQFGKAIIEGFDDMIMKPVKKDEFINKLDPPSDMIA